MKTPIVILCGLVVLALVIGGLQYTQHSREERILKAAERIDFRTEFSQPEQSSAPPGAVNMSSRITRLEQALAWFEASSSSSPSFAAAKEKLISPSKQRANESRSSRKMVVRNEESVALSASKNKKKIDLCAYKANKFEKSSFCVYVNFVLVRRALHPQLKCLHGVPVEEQVVPLTLRLL